MWVSFILFTAVLLPVVTAERGYIFTAPNVFRPGTEEHVCFTFHGIDFAVRVNVALDHPNVRKQHVFHHGKSGCFVMRIPRTSQRNSAKLLVSGAAENLEKHNYTFEGTKEVSIIHDATLTFIQTDKPIYKPGQTVKFRIVTLDTNLRPVLKSIPLVWIEDGTGSRLMQWKDVPAKKGLVSLELPLSSEPVLGEWKIRTKIEGEKQTQTFKVQEYVLPKFEVEIKPPAYILVSADNIVGQVCAKYTYGKPVKGNVKIEACVKQYYGGNRRPCAIILDKIDGCTKFTVDAREIMLASNSWSLWNAVLKVTAEVTEGATGIVQNATHDKTPITRELMKIQFDDSPEYFKPGLVYHGKCRVRKPDWTPMPGTTIELTILKNFRGTSGSEIMKRNYTTDAQGLITFKVPPQTPQVTGFYVKAEAPGYKFSYRPDVYFPFEPRLQNYVTAWYSPSGSHLQILPIEGPVACKENLVVNVTYTTKANTNIKFFYQVLSRGNIVLTGHKYHHFKIHDYVQDPDLPEVTTQAEDIPVQVTPHMGLEGPTPPNYELPGHVSHFHLDIPISPTMSSGAQLLVYYVREDGETVADSTEFDITQCFANKVDLTFGNKQRLPGQGTTLKLKAEAGSLCAVGVVDKSVHLLGGDNQLTMDKVFTALGPYSVSEASGYYEPDTYCIRKLSKQRPTVPDPPVIDSFNPEVAPPDHTQEPTPVVNPVVPRVDEEPATQAPQPQSKREKRRQKRSSYHHGNSGFYDAIRAFKRMGLIVLSDLVLETRPCHAYTLRTVYYSEMVDEVPGMQRPGSAVADNEIGGQSSEKSTSAVDLRTYFPETWLWDLQDVGDKGEVELQKTVPHTITEWVGSSFCVHDKVGFGVSKTTSVRAFQPFFVSFTLPYSIIRGERVVALVTVFNYLSECITVELTLKSGKAFRVHGSRSAKVCVCGSQARSHRFIIQPKQLGSINITVKGLSVQDSKVCGNNVIMSSKFGARDAVTRPLLVEAEGKEEEYAYNAFVCPGGKEHTEVADLPLPADLVPDSARAYLSVMGDVMGPSMSNLGSLLRMPSGCGEQNMLKFAPNIYILQYLDNTKQVSPEIRSKALEFMKVGYQRELTYKHTDGSYSAFGNRDPEGSMWLTAFVVKSFAQAKRYIYIDPKELEHSTKWIREKQLENGCFPQIGKVLHKAMKGGLAKGGSSHATLTAYVLTALFEAGARKDDPAVVEALHCLRVQKVKDVYTVALQSYAYSLIDATSAARMEIMDKLNKMATKEDGLIYWQKQKSVKKDKSKDDIFVSPYYQAPSAEVEMTSYALMAHLMSGQTSSVAKTVPIVRWITKQRNAYGGFASTQDTVVALQSLAQYASIAYRDGINMTVSATGKGVAHNFEVNQGNSLLLQKVKIPVPNKLTFKAKGQGCVFLQASVLYNTPNITEAQPAFQLKPTVLRVTSGPTHCKKRTISICTKYTGPEGVSNMAVVAVKMVSGWIPIKQSIKDLMKEQALELKKYEIDKNMVHFYFDQLDRMYKCLRFQVEQDLKVENAKEGMVRVYDYYNPKLAMMAPYGIKTTCGTKEELPYLRPGAIDPDAVGQVRQPVNLPLELMNKTNTASASEGCPKCMPHKPRNVVSLVCQSKHAYKTSVRSGRYPMKIHADLRPATKKSVNLFVRFKMEKSCKCPLLQHKKHKRVLILTKTSSVQKVPSKNNNKGKLSFNTVTTIFPLDRHTERQIFQAHKRHRCQ